MENKQTAVEWLLKELEEQKLIKLDKLSTLLFDKNFATRYELIVQQALAMEKEQIQSIIDETLLEYRLYLNDSNRIK